jgi:hypothetical protein
MVLMTCKKCRDINYLTSETVGNLTDFGYKCETRKKMSEVWVRLLRVRNHQYLVELANLHLRYPLVLPFSSSNRENLVNRPSLLSLKKRISRFILKNHP